VAKDISAIDVEALFEYERCFDAATIAASCEDYRAGRRSISSTTAPMPADESNARCWCFGALPVSVPHTTCPGFGRRRPLMCAGAPSTAVTFSPKNDPTT
jgi:hypothetical protein